MQGPRVAVTSDAPLTVMLQSDAQLLDLVTVVAVGYGQQKRTFVTGAVASANLDIVKDAPNTNIIQSLQGNVPGLNVGAVTSAGATPTIQIRSQNTLNGNTNALIIVDGVIFNSDLSAINPNDVASIDVLKDASATAVYGAQAANGVLMITTRKAKANSKTRINFSTSYATQTPSGNIRPYNRGEYLDKIKNLYWDQAWYESGPIKNVVIRNNNFKNFGLHGGTSPLIQITPDLKPDKDFYYHSNILVENNTCEVFSCPLVIAKSVEGFRFVGNRIKTSNDYPINPKGTRNFLFESCRDILIQNNIADRDWPGTKIKGVEAMLKYYKQ